jgi:preprotein translocase subunit SecF
MVDKINKSNNESDDAKNIHKDHGNVFLNIYDKHYKPLMILSILLLVFSVFAIGYQYATTGDFVNRGVSLTGGISLTIDYRDESLTSDALQSHLSQTFPKADINVRTFGSSGSLKYYIEASGVEEQALFEELQAKLPSLTLDEFNKNKQTIGPTFGESFFTQTLKAIFIAFVFMSAIIFLYFGESTKYKWLTSILSIVSAIVMFYSEGLFGYISAILIFIFLIYIYIKDSIPSFGIILCAFSDLLFALAIFNIWGHKLSIAGVAAFLMLVGYSIDTDILLSVRVLKRREGTIFSRTLDALKTGITMSFCALVAAVVAYIFTHSVVIKEIMFILIAGLVGDIIFTWIQNAGILRWHLEKKGWK